MPYSAIMILHKDSHWIMLFYSPSEDHSPQQLTEWGETVHSSRLHTPGIVTALWWMRVYGVCRSTFIYQYWKKGHKVFWSKPMILKVMAPTHSPNITHQSIEDTAHSLSNWQTLATVDRERERATLNTFKKKKWERKFQGNWRREIFLVQLLYVNLHHTLYSTL